MGLHLLHVQAHHEVVVELEQEVAQALLLHDLIGFLLSSAVA